MLSDRMRMCERTWQFLGKLSTPTSSSGRGHWVHTFSAQSSAWSQSLSSWYSRLMLVSRTLASSLLSHMSRASLKSEIASSWFAASSAMNALQISKVVSPSIAHCCVLHFLRAGDSVHLLLRSFRSSRLMYSRIQGSRSLHQKSMEYTSAMYYHITNCDIDFAM